MDLKLKAPFIVNNSEIAISGSKSETNRLLLLQALYPNIALENTSNSDDSEVMIKALAQTQKPTTNNRKPTIIEVHHAGTAMRFLTAFFATQDIFEVVLTGSKRMKERPIKILVDALRAIGAEIIYEEKEGFPPLKIKGKKLTKNKVSLSASVSSQYISALLLIATKLENGLELSLEGEITSVPYIKMTLALLNEVGIQTSFENNKIVVKSTSIEIPKKTIKIESDWSSASYFYSIIALAEIGTAITLSNFKKNSLQGDAILAEIYKDFGVITTYNENQTISIAKIAFHSTKAIVNDLKNCPDIAQTIAVTCFGLGIGCNLTGLHTLKIKETDRLEALKAELLKLDAKIEVTNDSLILDPFSKKIEVENITISTYQDHRMAMAFAPLALKTKINIENAEVVSKSYPDFWKDLKSIGFEISEI
jgi:3-phosphoshikimate 1-carboxyvinyltransferase